MSKITTTPVKCEAAAAFDEDCSCLLTKTEIEERMKSNAYQNDFILTPNDNCKSEVWKRFCLIYYKGRRQDFVKCVNCGVVLSHKTKTGTASLLRHKCEALMKLNEARVKFNISLEQAAQDSRVSEIALNQLYFVSKELLSLDCLEGFGFRKLAQSLINMGADYGRIDVDDVLADKRTLVRSLIPDVIFKLKSIIRGLMARNDLALTTDIWRDECGRKTFLTLTGNVITSEYSFRSFVLGTREVLEPQIGRNVQQATLQILREFLPNAEEKLASAVIVVDDDADVASGFEDFQRSKCVCSVLNGIIRDLFTDMPPEQILTLYSVRKLVVHFKSSGLESMLSEPLDQNRTSHWSDTYRMLKSVNHAYDDIVRVLTETNELHRLSGIDLIIFRDLLEFFVLFEKCSENLSAVSRPTINDVYLWQKTLHRYCSPIAQESEFLTNLKTRTLGLLQKHFQLSDMHKVALFLNPNFKSLRFLDECERIEIHDLVKRIIAKTNCETNGRRSSEAPTEREKSPTPAKKCKPEFFFKEFMDTTVSESDEEETAEEEMGRYIGAKLKLVSNDVLTFWKNNVEFPNIRSLVRKVLHVPACSASSARVFSSAGRNLETRRSYLLFDDMNALIFLNKNFDLEP